MSPTQVLLSVVAVPVLVFVTLYVLRHRLSTRWYDPAAKDPWSNYAEDLSRIDRLRVFWWAVRGRRAPDRLRAAVVRRAETFEEANDKETPFALFVALGGMFMILGLLNTLAGSWIGPAQVVMGPVLIWSAKVNTRGRKAERFRRAIELNAISEASGGTEAKVHADDTERPPVGHVFRRSLMRSRDHQELLAGVAVMTGVGGFVVLLGLSNGGTLPLGIAVGVALVIGHWVVPVVLQTRRYRREPDRIDVTSESLTVTSGRFLTDPLRLTWAQVAAVEVEHEVTDRHNYTQPDDTVALFATAWRRRVVRVRLAQPVVVRGHRWPWWRLYVIEALPPLYGPPLRGTRTTSTVRVALESPDDAVALASAAAAHVVVGSRPPT